MSDRLVVLDRFRGMAICMVVATHGLDYTNLSLTQKAFLSGCFQTVAVPAFFMVDGYLFALKSTSTTRVESVGFIYKSARRLLTPWVIFSLFYAFLRWWFEFLGFSAENIVYGRSAKEIIVSIYYSGVSSQMYFLPALFLVRVAATRFRALCGSSQWILVGSLIAYDFTFQVAHVPQLFASWLDPVLQGLWGMQFFILGVLVYKSVSNTSEYPEILRYRGVGLFLVALCSFFSPEFAMQNIYLVALFVLFQYVSGKQGAFLLLGQQTMGIYLLHIPICMRSSAAVLGLFLRDSSLLFYALLTACTLIFSYGVAVSVRILGGGFLFGDVVPPSRTEGRSIS